MRWWTAKIEGQDTAAISSHQPPAHGFPTQTDCVSAEVFTCFHRFQRWSWWPDPDWLRLCRFSLQAKETYYPVNNRHKWCFNFLCEGPPVDPGPLGFSKAQRSSWSTHPNFAVCFNMFQHVSTCFNMFQHVSTCFNMFQHVSTCFNMFARFLTLLM